MMTEIVLDGIVKDIKKVRVLDHISLTIQAGKIYGLRGKNGCGKTMLMRTICGLLLPTEGTICINGKVLHKDMAFPESVGALIENPSFLKQYTGFRNLQILAKLQAGITDDDIKLALERVGLDPDDKRTYGKYSLGMKQKLGIANAILGEPDVIILDEPINALDEDAVKLVKNTLITLRNQGKLIIIACHDREELEYLSDVVFVMSEGRIIRKEEIADEAVTICEA